MITRTRDTESVVDRVGAFLDDLYKQINEDDNETPRVLYTAMTYKLGGCVVGVIQRRGIVKRDGWRWLWIGGRVSKRMILSVREDYLEQMRGYYNVRG